MRADPDDPLGQRQDRMADRNAQTIEADRELSAIVQGAYENTLNFRARLGQISEEIEQRVQNQDQALADSLMAVTEFTGSCWQNKKRSPAYWLTRAPTHRPAAIDWPHSPIGTTPPTLPKRAVQQHSGGESAPPQG